MAIIETKKLSKIFKSNNGPVEAVKGIDLSVTEGHIFGFLGTNGAGKTTTMRMLTTLVTPTSGQASIAGFDLIKESQKVRQSIGYVSQAGGLQDSSTARENLILQARLYGMNKHDAETRAEELIQRFQIQGFADRYVKQYSGGQRRKVDIALGIVHKPKVLFLDEPTVGLDPQHRASLWQEVRQLKDLGTTVFLTTHYLEEADSLCDTLAIIDNGTIVIEGTPLSLKKQIPADVITLLFNDMQAHAEVAKNMLMSEPFVRKITNEKDGIRLYVDQKDKALPHILKMLESSGIAPESISMTSATLDDVFLQKTGRSLLEKEN